MDIKTAIENTKEIFMTDSSLQYLLDFERVLDELDIYAFKNWKQGELVKGPIFEKYFISASFMWPYKKMPDPRALERLQPFNIECTFEKDEVRYPIKATCDEGETRATMHSASIWLVTITMPKKLMYDIQQGSAEVEGQTVELDDIESAYEDNLDDTTTEFDDDSEL